MRILYTVVALVLFVSVAATAQQPMKFGHINTAEVLQALPELKQIESQIEAVYKEKEDQLMVMQEDLKAKQTEYQQVAQTLSDAERSAKEQEIMELNQKVQNYYLLSQQQIKAKQEELQAPVIQKVQTAIREVGDEEGFLYIFELSSRVPVYNSDKSIDVAPLVKAKLGI